MHGTTTKISSLYFCPVCQGKPKFSFFPYCIYVTNSMSIHVLKTTKQRHLSTKCFRIWKQHNCFEVFQTKHIFPSGKGNLYMKMSMELWWNDIGRVKQKYSETNLFQRHFVLRKSHIDWFEIETELLRWKPSDRPPELWHGLNTRSESIFFNPLL